VNWRTPTRIREFTLTTEECLVEVNTRPGPSRSPSRSARSTSSDLAASCRTTELRAERDSRCPQANRSLVRRWRSSAWRVTAPHRSWLLVGFVL
jgi:hypothetical protein